MRFITEKHKLVMKDILKLCKYLNNVTKMDIKFIDKYGNELINLCKHNIPEILYNYEDDYASINKSLSNNNHKSYYYYINSYNLEYIASGLWEKDSYKGFIIIGPFISNTLSMDFISDIIYKNKFPITERDKLQEFYESLIIINSSYPESLGSLLTNLCSHKFEPSNLITSYVIKPSIDKEELRYNIEENKDTIESRYKLEKNFFHAIASGNKNEVINFFNDSNNPLYILDRIPESPIRSLKNLLFVLNTICRLAAESGGLHPIYINSLSEKFAIMIKRAPNLPYLKKLAYTLANEYCDAVNALSNNKYSSIVRKAIEYINLNLEKNFTVKDIADSIPVNLSHLSRKFKKETSMTITDYINKNRIKEAKLYLQGDNVSITEVSLMVGFNDLNYFCRVFKKFTSMTPSQYIKNIKLHTKYFENNDIKP